MPRKSKGKCGEILCFHGAFFKKSDAERKRATLSKKARVLFRAMGASGFRYVVVSPKRRKRERAPF